MGRGATKAKGNRWFEARIEAAKWNERLSSRAGAADEMGLSEDAVKSAELGLYKAMPVENAVLMADCYGAPELKNYYCLFECPIGKDHAISTEVNNIDRLTVKTLKVLRLSDLESFKERMLDVSADGKVDKDELDELEECAAYLDDVAKIASELKILVGRIKGR